MKGKRVVFVLMVGERAASFDAHHDKERVNVRQVFGERLVEVVLAGSEVLALYQNILVILFLHVTCLVLRIDIVVDGEPSVLMPSGNAVNNARLTFDGEERHSRPIMWWDIDTKYDVYGYYPYASPSSVEEYRFSVKENQAAPGTETELGGYEASDFLWAKASGVSYPQKVKLQFSHRMSRIVINLSDVMRQSWSRRT